jgi:hypothetical protein
MALPSLTMLLLMTKNQPQMARLRQLSAQENANAEQQQRRTRMMGTGKRETPQRVRRRAATPPAASPPPPPVSPRLMTTSPAARTIRALSRHPNVLAAQWSESPVLAAA